MSNRISILLEQGLPISQILFSHQRNDIIELTFLNGSSTNTEEEINYAKLFSADIINMNITLTKLSNFFNI